MNRLRKTLYFKITALVLTGLFLFQGNALLAQEQGENLDLQLKKAISEYSAGNIEKALIRLGRLAAACENRGIEDADVKRKYGQALLLQGICHEFLKDVKKAGEFYQKVKELSLSSDDRKLADLDLSRLKIYKNVIEKEGSHRRKKFPWLWVAGGAAAVIILYFLLKKKPQQTLTVSVGEGVEGTPANGTQNYKKGITVNYSFSLKNGYRSLVVQVDGQAAPSTGSIKMDRDHILSASASRSYTLTVNRGPGVDGTPGSTSSYSDGEIVNYNYTLQSGYTELVVTIDGVQTNPSGSIIMNRDHTLTASAKKLYTLTVTKGIGVIGLPESGTYSYKEGDTASYNYGLQRDYRDLAVTIDGTPAAASGTITMDKDHALSAISNAGMLAASQQ